MSKYWDWLWDKSGTSFLWAAMVGLHLFIAGCIVGLVLVGFMLTAVWSYGVIILIPIVWTYWYYRKYGVDDE